MSGEETFAVPRYVIEDAIGLLSATAEDRKGASATIERLRAICPPLPDETPELAPEEYDPESGRYNPEPAE